MNETVTKDEHEGTISLIGAIVEANAKNLQHTTDWLIEALERDIVTVGEVLSDVINVFDEATVVDRRTEARMRELNGRIYLALDVYGRKAAKFKGEEPLS